MSQIGIARSVVWSVRQAVARSRAVRWAVRQSAAKSRSVLFNVVAPVGAAVVLARSVSWNVAALTEVARPLVAGVRATVNVVAAPYLDSDRPFARVMVDFLTAGNSLVSWELSPRFFGTAPYTFQVQTSETDSPAADDWVDVGAPVVNAFFFTDEERRWKGKARLPGYRVRLTTATGSRYLSQPAATVGNLDWRDWRLAQEVIRKERLRHRWQTSVEGVLFKRKRAGVACTRCLDGSVGAATDSACPVCYGTAWVGGYYPPLVAAYADVSLEETQEQRSPQGLGMEQPVAVTARFVGWPFPAAKDVWAAGTTPFGLPPTGSDLRYVVDGIKVITHLRGVPLVLDVTLKKLPPEDVVYTISKEPVP